jgi:hypothetical protein
MVGRIKLGAHAKFVVGPSPPLATPAALEHPCTSPLPHHQFSHQSKQRLDQNNTMPATLSTTMLSSSPLPSKSPQHVP